MNALKPALIAATIAFAGPALAGGGPSFVYFPNLTYPTQDATVTRGSATVLDQSEVTCSQLEQNAGVKADACGTLAKTELVKRKLAGDQ